MTEDLSSDAARGVMEIAKLASGHPRMKTVGDNVAFSLETVTGIVKTVLMPLAVANAKAQAYFQGKFPEDLAERLREVPEEDISAPRPSVAGPVLQGLNYSHEEVPLRGLYLGLLAKSMDGRAADDAHPGFAAIIGALATDEVRPLQVVLRSDVSPAVQLREKAATGSGFRVVTRHVLSLAREEGLYVNAMLTAYADNWARLGLVQIEYDSYLTADDAYDWVEERPEYLAAKSELDDENSLVFQKGIVRATEFGRAFAKAVGMLD